MKRKVLLIDDSVTVQKVVALSLEREPLQVLFATNRNEAIEKVRTEKPDLILASDQLKELPWASLPKEIESWLGIPNPVPVVLITSQNISVAKHYHAVLKKPFTPDQLKTALGAALPQLEEEKGAVSAIQSDTADRIQESFHQKFKDEESLVRQTFKHHQTHAATADTAGEGIELWSAGEKEQGGNDLWSPNGKGTSGVVLSASDSLAYKATLASKVEDTLSRSDIDKVVNEVLGRIVPPIVERLVKERLDELLKTQEEMIRGA